MQEIVLAPLACEDLRTANCGFSSLRAGARQSAGATGPREDWLAIHFSPFSLFLRLPKKALLTFDHSAARWSWDLNRIHAKGYTDNVVDLMVGKLNRLPLETQKALQQLACLGNRAEIALLSIVHKACGGGRSTRICGRRSAPAFIVRSEGFV